LRLETETRAKDKVLTGTVLRFSELVVTRLELLVVNEIE
jgi:hypothetical protein